METSDFLRRILPETGTYILATPYDKGGFNHKIFSDTAAMAASALSTDATGRTVYHAWASFADGTLPKNSGLRTAENALAVRCQPVDLDVGEGKAYPTQNAAIAALLFTCRQLALPVPMLVSSGRGVHAYWVFDADQPAATALPVSQALARACQQHGLICDPAITAQQQSVLRPIGTHWYKETPPREVCLLRDAAPTSFAEFAEKLAAFVQAPALSLPKNDAPDEWGTGPREFPPSSILQIAQHCPVVGACAADGTGLAEPFWRVLLGLAKHTVEGEAWAHTWSATDPRYTRADTQAKLDHWTGGPPTCATIEASGGACAGCKHRGTLTSPITLGYADEAPSAPLEPPAAPPQAPVELRTHARLAPAGMPFMPKRYRWDGTALAASSQDDEGVYHWERFALRWVYPYNRVRDADGTITLLLCSLGADTRWQLFDMPAALLADHSAMAKHLAAHEVFLCGKHGKAHMSAFLQDVLGQLEHQGIETQTVNAFGWTDDGFILGDTLISSTKNQPRPVLLGTRVPPALANGFRVAGTSDEWARLINEVYNRRGAEAYQFAICAAFGAPLVQLAASDLWHGIPIALTGPSGVGKSTTCLAACSMYGPPSSMMTAANTEGTTANALIQLVAVARNIPLLLDEVHAIKGADLPQLLYALSNGKPKNRLKADATFADQGLNWNTLTFVTSNRNIMSDLGSGTQSQAEATQVRIFEIALDKHYARTFADIDAHDLIVNQLLANQYGMAGRKYLSAIAPRREGIGAALRRTRARFVPNDSEATRERFYYDLLATALIGGKLAKTMGLIQFDLHAIEDWAFAHIQTLRHVRKDTAPSSDDQLQSLLAAVVDRTVRTKRFPKFYDRSPPEHVDTRGLRIPIARLASDDRVLILTASGLRELCRDHNIDAKAVQDRIQAQGLLKPPSWLGGDGRCYPFRGTDLPNAGVQARALVFDLDALEGVIAPSNVVALRGAV